mmetsp:Transcript_1836/g.4159  ORF Transcript_1836/g.4159 Transcript_1836/m.4159 type:complete len:209 (-) Transcript_1836:156-782(-)
MSRCTAPVSCTPEHVRIRAKAHCMASDEKTGMVKLSFRRNGSYSSVSVAASAPKKTGYSRRCTGAKMVEPTRKQTRNMAVEPSMDFFPCLPSFIETVSPPNDTPMIAALMSPSTRKRIEAIAIEGGDVAMQRVQPRLKKHAPVRWVFSSSRKSCRIGQFLDTVSSRSRAVSANQPMAVMATHRPTQNSVLKPMRRSSWCVRGTSRPHR